MKKKIYKVLGVMLALAIVMSTCVCAIWNASADTTLEFAMGNVHTQTGGFNINPQTHRATVTEALALDDYESVTIKEGWKAFFYAVKSDGTTLSDTTGNGSWATGSYALSGLTGKPDATYFTITVAKAAPNDNANFTLEDIPEDVVTLKEAGFYAQGNVKTAEGGKFVLNGTSGTRVTTRKLLVLDDYESVTLATGYKAWLYAYKADGTLVDTTGSGRWVEQTTYALSELTSSAEAVYFSVTVATMDNAAITPDTVPEDALTLKAAGFYAQGNVKTAEGGKFVLNGTSGTRVTTRKLLVLDDYESVTLATGYKAWLYAYKADGTLVDTTGSGRWIEQTTYALSSLTSSADAVYFSVTVATMDNAAITPDTVPEDALTLTKAKMFTQGNVKTAEGGKLVINSTSGTRVTTRKLIPIGDYSRVTPAAGYKAWYYAYKLDGTLVDTTGSKAWLEGGYALSNLTKLSEDAAYFSITLAYATNAEAGTTDNANITPDDVAEDAVVFTAAECAGHTYSNDCDALCNECRKIREVGDHVYDNACDAECNNCGATREVGDHVYENYVSNGDATCEADGTKTGTCACGATDTITDEGSKLDHVYENYVSNGDATCEADGTKTGTCVCGATDTIADEGSKLDHVYENYVSNGDATCEADGTKTGTCACGATDTITDEGSKLDHTYENYTSNGDATCTANGTETGTCVCGATDTREDADSKLDHTYENYTYNNDATCTANGTETGTCVCSATDTREVADTMLDHSWKRPTCTEPKTCGVCGATVGEAFGHDYDTSYDKDCNVCGAVRETEAITDIEIRDGKVYIEGKTSIRGLFCVDGEYYFADWGGVIKTGGTFYVKTSYCDLAGGKNYLFDEEGKMVHEEIIDGILYIHGRTATKGIYKIDGEYYFSTWGGVIEGGLHTTSYVENCDLPAGTYRFDENGKMLDNALYIDENGVKYIYVKGRTCVPGLYEIDGKLYAATWGGVVRTEGRYFVKNSFCDTEANGYFYCDANGFAEAI